LKQPDEITLFVDRSLGKNIVPAALKAVGALVEIHDNHFSPDAPDETWLSEVTAKGWIILTKDKRIQYRATEIAAVQSAGAAVFALTAGSVTGQEMASIFVNALPKMRLFAAREPRPFIARVTRAGAVNLVFPKGTQSDSKSGQE
jgi:hypothetical protein